MQRSKTLPKWLLCALKFEKPKGVELVFLSSPYVLNLSCLRHAHSGGSAYLLLFFPASWPMLLPLEWADISRGAPGWLPAVKLLSPAVSGQVAASWPWGGKELLTWAGENVECVPYLSRRLPVHGGAHAGPRIGTTGPTARKDHF